MHKTSILIDTNALSHLARISVDLDGVGTVGWLWREFNVHTCETVYNEFTNGVSRGPAGAKAIARKLFRNERNSNGVECRPALRYTQVLESRWLHPKYYSAALDDADRGERHLVCAAAEIASRKMIGKFVVVTDDHSALRKFVKAAMKEHPFAEVWNSLDLVLYMYLTCNSVTEGFAKEAVRDIGGLSSFSIFDSRAHGEADISRRTSLIIDYHRRIRTITGYRNLLRA